MVLLSCRATARRRWFFRTAAVYAFSGSILSICCFIMLELYTYMVLDRAKIITMLDEYMPVINRKALGVAVMGCMVLFIQIMSINIVRGQEVVRLRASLKTFTEKFLTMTFAIVILLFVGALCLVYANGLKSNIARGLLKIVVNYDEKADAREFIDRIQIAYNCCGINGAEDYQDLSAVNLHGIKNPLPNDRTLRGCPHEDIACLYPISCCFSVECTQYRLAELNIEGDRFHERWYKNKGNHAHQQTIAGCVAAILSSHFGLLDPKLPIFLVSLSLGLEMLGLLFAQLTLTGYMTLAESGLSDADESIAWLLPFSYPGPEDLVQVY
ncbi:hypothetical protein OESDEN_21596 [Oesophagostomum dentatum]|uniref:Tetraspanin n=1 Tax=Oesophagostomum dentatum TaxID=61180 RepID=A0A0B1S6E4_OESDE|nr:hypothetical protein OESDEN_21596 [Oesophagostomum dentatum]